MQLQTIDKQLYRSRLNMIIVGCIAVLATLSLSISQLLILIWPSETGSHFSWNLLGVIIAAIVVATTLVKLKTHPKMHEAAYVWDLKQQLNRIYRKNRKLLAAAEQGNGDAMLALQFSYDGSRQLWQLDDNTITINSLNTAQAQLDRWVNEFDVQIDVRQYHPTLLDQF